MLFSSYEFEHTNVNMDLISLVFHDDKAPLGNCGCYCDYVSDKDHINIDIIELADPITLPLGITVVKDNMTDQIHFKETYRKKDSIEMIFHYLKDEVDMKP